MRNLFKVFFIFLILNIDLQIIFYMFCLMSFKNFIILLIVLVLCIYLELTFYSYDKKIKVFNNLSEELKALIKIRQRSLNVRRKCEKKKQFPVVTNQYATEARDLKKLNSSLNYIRMNKYQELQKAFYENYIFMPNRNLLWCMIPKAASTSVSLELLLFETMENLQIVQNYSSPHQKLLFLYRNLEVRTFFKIKQNVTSFYIARHPFERLVSAYINLFKLDTFKEIGKYIVQNYGNKDNLNRTDDIANKNTPTFNNFIEYLLDTDIMDYNIHWKPESNICKICLIEHDFIIKFDHFNAEFSALITHLKNSNKLPLDFQTRWENRERPNNVDSKSITIKYMNQIPLEKVYSLYMIYSDDFYFFDYTVNEYFIRTV